MSMTSNAHAEAVSADSFPCFVMMQMGDAPFFVWFESKEQYKKYVAHVDTITDHYNKYVHFVNGHNVIKCAILSMTQWNPESLGLPSPEYVSRESVDLAMQSLHHKVCSRQLWQNSM
jgi:hypothetical protein